MRGIRDGDLYKTVTVHGKTFELRYGYYEEYERESAFSEPIPIYPDFLKNPIYTDDGRPFVTGMQTLCKHAACEPNDDACCAYCKHYDEADELIGICQCTANRKKSTIE